MFNRKLVIETERLVIRALDQQDSQDLYEIMKDREMTLYTPDENWKSLEEAGQFLNLVFWLYNLEHDTFRHFLAITLKQTGELIGMCGVGGMEYDRTQNELFYHIGKKHWGKGYATEAANTLLKYAFDDLKLNKVLGIVHPDNEASNRVMEKIGMKNAGELRNLSEEFKHFEGERLYCLEKTTWKRN